MTFSQIVDEVCGRMNLSSTEAKLRVGVAVNRHYKRITSSIGMDATRFVTRTATTTNGVQTVTFSNIEKIDRILDTTSGIRPTTEALIDTLRTETPGTGEPCRWATQSTGASSVTVLLDTVPQTTYTLQADGRATLADLTADDEPAFAESFHDVITWSVLAEEYLRKEKPEPALAYESKAEKLIGEMRWQFADSPSLVVRQGDGVPSGSGGAGGSASSQGGSAYTQSAPVTFDLGAGVAPFNVAQATAAVVTNLDADKLDGQHGAYYLTASNLAGVTTDKLLGRDTAGTGGVEYIGVGGGLEFDGSQGIRIADLGVSTAKIANDAVSYAKLQNVSATSRLLGRKTALAGDAEECTLSEVLDFIGSAAQGDILFRGASAWTRLGAGTNGQFLKTQGTGANPIWATVGGTVIASLQRGTISIGTGAASNTATISSVTTTKAVCLFGGFDAGAVGAGGPEKQFARVVLTNATTVTATRSASDASSVVTVAYEVLEFL